VHRGVISIGINIDVIYKSTRVIWNSSGKLYCRKETERGWERIQEMFSRMHNEVVHVKITT
jgi:hypothetical protein